MFFVKGSNLAALFCKEDTLSHDNSGIYYADSFLVYLRSRYRRYSMVTVLIVTVIPVGCFHLAIMHTEFWQSELSRYLSYNIWYFGQHGNKFLYAFTPCQLFAAHWWRECPWLSILPCSPLPSKMCVSKRLQSLVIPKRRLMTQAWVIPLFYCLIGL